MTRTALDKSLIGLGVRQPWAELIVSGVKTIEVRSQPTNVRGPIYIYAAKNLSDYPDAEVAIGEHELDVERLPRGVVIGTANIVDCHPTSPEDAVRACVSESTLKRHYAWELSNAVRLEKPVKPKFLPYGVWFYPFKARPRPVI